ncbi:MAG: amidohydrolase family protein [Planctomycetota bacterium]|nr:MAG: amidohydrolase family protein [Planctomycetota bacterium]
MADKKETEQYQQIDLPFYKNEIAPILPDKVLDFHTHIYIKDTWKSAPWRENAPGGKYMVIIQDYSIEDLLYDGQIMFPDKSFNAVCFGMPTPAVDLDKTNDYTIQTLAHPGLYPLIITGRGLIPPDQLEEAIVHKGFLGYKVFLNWFGDDYGNITVADMIGPAEMKLADRRRLIVLLHVPGAERLTSPQVQKDVELLSKDYPQAGIVLAHCGRCYLPDEAKRAMGAIRQLENVYLDTSMVMDPTVIEIILDHIDSSRLLFATDLPIANMRGRRVYVMDHWVDLVLEGYPDSKFRVGSNNMRATFMVYEIILAIRRAAERVGLSDELLRNIFYQNGMNILQRVAGKG